MKLSAKTRYASRILLDLALHDTGTPQRVNEIAERTGITVPFIEQIIKPLKHAELVVSKRGASGGYMLSRPAENIFLGDILRIMEGSAMLSVCLDSPESCVRADLCPTRAAWKRASDALLRELDTISLADLTQDGDEYCRIRTQDGTTQGQEFSSDVAKSASVRTTTVPEFFMEDS